MSRFLVFRGDGPRANNIASAHRPEDAARIAEGDAHDALLSFQPEGQRVAAAPVVLKGARPVRNYFVVASAAAVAAAVISGVVVYERFASASRPAATSPGPGTVMVDSHPPGTVTIDGIARGSTPLVVSLPAGQHDLEIAVGTTVRSWPLTVQSGTTTRQDMEFPSAVPMTTGQLDISSEPSGAQVKVDGVARGATPLKIDAMTAGKHEVVMSSGLTTIRQTVSIKPGATASIVGSMGARGSTGSAAEATLAGWVSLKAPFGLDVLEDGQMIGTTAAPRLMLPAGAHRLDLKSGTFEVATTVSVQVVAGKTVNVTVPVPNGLLSINATPWANVTIDGQDVGATPLANLSVPVGPHEIVWRNPQLGERRRSIDVTTRSAVRVGMDFAQ